MNLKEAVDTTKYTKHTKWQALVSIELPAELVNNTFALSGSSFVYFVYFVVSFPTPS